ncbi:MAG TPA: hypothetical protein VIL46_09255 [Gemmataceae bacterium]
MNTQGQTESRALRIEPGELKNRIESGERVTVLDARSEQAWRASETKIRDAIRVDPQHFRPDPSWEKNCLTVVYCT